MKTGIVTGGQYGSKQGCQPYAIAHCSHSEPGKYPNCTGIERTPKCQKTCEPSYSKSFDDDKHYGSSAYAVSNSVAEIQTEIMTNGPVEGSFRVYGDFPTYTSGMINNLAVTVIAEIVFSYTSIMVSRLSWQVKKSR